MLSKNAVVAADCLIVQAPYEQVVGVFKQVDGRPAYYALGQGFQRSLNSRSEKVAALHTCLVEHWVDACVVVIDTRTARRTLNGLGPSPVKVDDRVDRLGLLIVLGVMVDAAMHSIRKDKISAQPPVFECGPVKCLESFWVGLAFHAVHVFGDAPLYSLKDFDVSHQER